MTGEEGFGGRICPKAKSNLERWDTADNQHGACTKRGQCGLPRIVFFLVEPASLREKRRKCAHTPFQGE